MILIRIFFNLIGAAFGVVIFFMLVTGLGVYVVWDLLNDSRNPETTVSVENHALASELPGRIYHEPGRPGFPEKASLNYRSEKKVSVVTLSPLQKLRFETLIERSRQIADELEPDELATLVDGDWKAVRVFLQWRGQEPLEIKINDSQISTVY